LLASNATLSLYVNDFNRDAIALYERTGFVQSGTMSTLLFA
jgi:predicted GNAT family acetyltransferase